MSSPLCSLHWLHLKAAASEALPLSFLIHALPALKTRRPGHTSPLPFRTTPYGVKGWLAGVSVASARQPRETFILLNAPARGNGPGQAECSRNDLANID